MLAIGDNSMNAVTLDPDLWKQLSVEAERRHTDIETLIHEWLKENLQEQRDQKFEEEWERYLALYPQLRENYANKVIALLDGVIIDSGDELFEVYQRVQAKYPDESFVVTRVGLEPMETYRAPSPRLVDTHPIT
jgi:hypothetical protein